MVGREAEAELTLGNAASASPGKLGWREEGGSCSCPWHCLRYGHGASEAAGLQQGMNIPNPETRLSPENKLNPYSLSW